MINSDGIRFEYAWQQRVYNQEQARLERAATTKQWKKPELNPRFGMPNQTPFPDCDFRDPKTRTYLHKPYRFYDGIVDDRCRRDFLSLPDRLQMKLIVLMLGPDPQGKIAISTQELKILHAKGMLYERDILSSRTANTAKRIGEEMLHRVDEFERDTRTPRSSHHSHRY